jgi:LmbE family N-acetylglucosaminyl deacetylase
MDDDDRDLLHDVRPGDRWLAVVAHPDDESFGCGSVLARAAALGAQVTVLCATRGEAGEATPGTAGPDLGAVREAELRRAAVHLGATAVELLGHRDSGFDGTPAADALCAVPEEVLTEEVGVVLDRVRPDVVVVLDGSDGHRDHLHVRAAVRSALAAGGAPALYEHCLPNALLRRWLEEMRGLRPDTAYHALDPAALGRPDDDITDVLDVRDVLDRREAAIAEHRSQTSPFEGLSEELRSAFLTEDHLVRVHPGRHEG